MPDSSATPLPGVFAGGDLTNGGETAVRAVADGMRAAKEIDRYLTSPLVPLSNVVQRGEGMSIG